MAPLSLPMPRLLLALGWGLALLVRICRWACHAALHASASEQAPPKLIYWLACL